MKYTLTFLLAFFMTSMALAVSYAPQGFDAIRNPAKTVTWTLPSVTGTLSCIACTEVLTNKTLSGNTATTLISGSGTLTLNTSGTITVPNFTDTLVTKANTDTINLSGAIQTTHVKTTGGANAIDLANRWIWNGGSVLADFSGARFQFFGGWNTYSADLGSTLTFRFADGGSNHTVFWPASQGAASTYLKNDGSGNLSWYAGATANTASTIAQRDASANLSANSMVNGYATTATAAGTTTLTVASAQQQYFTGSTTQTAVLPVTSTLVTGQEFIITNLSSGAVTVQSSGANSIVAMAQNTTLIAKVISTSGTGTSSWSWNYQSAQNSTVGGGSVTSVAMTVPSGMAISGSPITTSGTLALTGVPYVGVAGSKTSNYTLVNGTDNVVYGSCAGGSFDFTLPTAVGVTGQQFTMIRTNQTASVAITIKTTSAQTIGEFASAGITLDIQGESLTVVSDGANWQIVSYIIPEKSYTITASGPAGWSTTASAGFVRKSRNGVWRLAFNVNGTHNSLSDLTVTLTGFTFGNGGYQTAAAYDISTGTATIYYSRIDNGATGVHINLSTGSTNTLVSADVQLASKPTIAM